MSIADRVAEAILTYNRVINVMSPNTVYMGLAERSEIVRMGVDYNKQLFLGMQVVPVKLDNYLQVARVEQEVVRVIKMECVAWDEPIYASDGDLTKEQIEAMFNGKKS